MGRVTEFIDFLHVDSPREGHSLIWYCHYNYSYITKSDKLMKVRKEYRRNIKQGEVK
tara:strand:+ start:1039 stop:1209 length:171 start_codon:yes stop_codon:yes gene_type:complete